MTVKLVSSLNPACYRPVSLIGRSVQACSGRQLETSQTRVGFREEGGEHRQLRDRWWQILLATNVHLSAYWRALPQRWFMHAATSITSNIPRSDISPYPSADAKSGLVISASHAVRLVRRRWDLSLGRICTCPLPEETSAVSLWMTLFITAQKAPIFNIVKANSCCQITKIARCGGGGSAHTDPVSALLIFESTSILPPHPSILPSHLRLN